MFDISPLQIFSKNFLVYFCKCCNLIGYATRYIFVDRYPGAARNATTSSFFASKRCLFLIFWNNFEEIKNTSLFLLKQLDYSLNFYEAKYFFILYISYILYILYILFILYILYIYYIYIIYILYVLYILYILYTLYILYILYKIKRNVYVNHDQFTNMD